MKRVGVVLTCLVCLAVEAPGQELRLGAVRIGLGAAEAPVVAALRESFLVRQIEGGWDVHSRDTSDLRAPVVGIGTQNGRVTSVSFLWGPGPTPSVEHVSEQLSYALPSNAECQIRNVVRPSEGGIVRTLTFQCGKTIVRSQTGTWAAGNTASLSIEQE